MRYAAGIKLFVLGERLRERFDVLAVARREMARLRDETGHAVTLSALVDEQVVILDLIEGHSFVNFGTQPGTVPPLHASAHGKVALAFGPADLLSRCLCETAEGLDAAYRLHRDGARACRGASQVARLGYVAKSGSAGHQRSRCAGLQPSGAYAGAIAVAGTVQTVPGSPPPELINAVTRAASQVSRHLGHSAK